METPDPGLSLVNPWGRELPRWHSGEESACNEGDAALIPGLGRSPGGENGYPLRYSCLENPMDRGDWQATVHRFAESDTTERLTLGGSPARLRGVALLAT